jgi:hypothetical protein
MKYAIFFLSFIFTFQIYAADSMKSNLMDGTYSFREIPNEQFFSEYHKHYNLYFQTTCKVPVYIYFSYLNSYNQWETDGPWTIRPGESVHIGDTENRIYYFGGAASDGRTVWSGDRPIRMEDGTVMMLIEGRISLDRFDDWITELYCN